MTDEIRKKHLEQKTHTNWGCSSALTVQDVDALFDELDAARDGLTAAYMQGLDAGKGQYRRLDADLAAARETIERIRKWIRANSSLTDRQIEEVINGR